jgi:hypothetical protein
MDFDGDCAVTTVPGDGREPVTGAASRLSDLVSARVFEFDENP